MSHFGSSDLLIVLVAEHRFMIICTVPAEQCTDAAVFTKLYLNTTIANGKET